MLLPLRSIFLVLAAREHITDWRWLLARYAILLILQAGVAVERRWSAAYRRRLPVGPGSGDLRLVAIHPRAEPRRTSRRPLDVDRPSHSGRQQPEPLARTNQHSLAHRPPPGRVPGLLRPSVRIAGDPVLPAGPPSPRSLGRHATTPGPSTCASWLNSVPTTLAFMRRPAIWFGPRFALASTYRTGLTGFLVAEPIRHFLDALEGTMRDAFPSGHVSAALLSVHYMFRFLPRQTGTPCLRSVS